MLSAADNMERTTSGGSGPHLTSPTSWRRRGMSEGGWRSRGMPIRGRPQAAPTFGVSTAAAAWCSGLLLVQLLDSHAAAGAQARAGLADASQEAGIMLQAVGLGGADVLQGQVRVTGDDLLGRQAAAEFAQDMFDGDARIADHRLAEHDLRITDDAVVLFHEGRAIPLRGSMSSAIFARSGLECIIGGSGPRALMAVRRVGDSEARRDPHPASPTSWGRWLQSAACASGLAVGPAMGTLQVTCVPSPGVECSSTLPWCSSTSFFTRARPRPAPVGRPWPEMRTKVVKTNCKADTIGLGPSKPAPTWTRHADTRGAY